MPVFSSVVAKSIVYDLEWIFLIKYEKRVPNKRKFFYLYVAQFYLMNTPMAHLATQEQLKLKFRINSAMYRKDARRHHSLLAWLMDMYG